MQGSVKSKMIRVKGKRLTFRWENKESQKLLWQLTFLHSSWLFLLFPLNPLPAARQTSYPTSWLPYCHGNLTPGGRAGWVTNRYSSSETLDLKGAQGWWASLRTGLRETIGGGAARSHCEPASANITVLLSHKDSSSVVDSIFIWTMWFMYWSHSE